MLDSCVQVQRFKRIRKLKAIAMLMRLVALCQCFTGMYYMYILSAINLYKALFISSVYLYIVRTYEKKLVVK